MKYTFIDTCILCELLEIDGRSTPEGTELCKAEFDERKNRGERFIIPSAVVVEVGNHIAHIKHDINRKSCVLKFKQFLEKSVHDESPWKLYTEGVDKQWMTFLVENMERITGDIKIGAGDLTIWHQYQKFKETAVSTDSVGIWSKDSDISILEGIFETESIVKKGSRRRDR